MMTADIPNPTPHFGEKEILHSTDKASVIADAFYNEVVNTLPNVTWTNRDDLSALSLLVDSALREATMDKDSKAHAGYLDIAQAIPGNVFANQALQWEEFDAEHNSFAAGLVHSLLGAEKDQKLMKSLSMVSYRSTEESLLDHVISAYVKNDQDPNFWIEEYGYDKADKWQLTERYLTNKLTASWEAKASQRDDMQAYTEHARRLLAQDLPVEFVMEQLPNVVDRIADGHTVQEIIDHFYTECFNNAPTSLAGFNRVIKMGLFSLGDAELEGMFNSEEFVRQTISDYEARLRSNGENEYSILFTRFNWDMENDLAPETSLTANETIERLSIVERNLITAAGDSSAGKDAAVMLRDSYLKDRFEKSLRQEDLDNAWTYLECATPTSKADMLKKYLACADVGYPALNPFIAMREPYLQYIYRFAEATRTSETDMNELRQLALECANGIGGEAPEEEKAVRFDCLSSAQGIIRRGSDSSEEALNYTRQLVATLRENGAEYKYIKQLAFELILSGDEQELLRVRADIEASNQTDAVKLLDKWTIAQAIWYSQE